MSCPCGANCQARNLPDWLRAQLAGARSGFFVVAGIGTNGFCCPLCLRILPVRCATLAHAPSKEVGGAGQTFLCKACNSFLGSAYEASADTSISTIEEAKASGGSTTHKITLSHRKGPHVYMDAVFSGGKDKRIEAKPRRRNKEAEARFGAERKPGEPLFLRFQVPNELHLKLAFLSWAYLLLFRRLGYAFVFSKSGKLAREALLTGSAAKLSRAFFFTYGDFEGETSPTAAGLLVRSEGPDFDAAPPVAMAAVIGSSVVSLPLAEDPHDRYSHLFEYASDDSRLIVLPFEALFPSHASVMAGIADYRWRDRDGSEHRILTTNRDDVRSAVTNAKAPPSKRPSRGPIRDNPDFPPPVLPLPPKPRAETWRASAAAYLAARNALPDADSEADDLAWIDAVRRIDPVAARHITDMRNLFLLGQDPRKSAEPRGMAVMADLNAVAAEHDPEARVVAGDFRLAAPGEDFGSLSLRVLRGDLDAVVGPHYTYQTLVFALRETLTHGSGKGNDSPTPDDRSA